MSRKGGSLIKYGKIEIAAEEEISVLVSKLTEIIKRHGYPEQESIYDDEDEEVDVSDLFKDDEVDENEEKEEVKPPWMRSPGGQDA